MLMLLLRCPKQVSRRKVLRLVEVAFVVVGVEVEGKQLQQESPHQENHQKCLEDWIEKDRKNREVDCCSLQVENHT
jgi:hypothetical protein